MATCCDIREDASILLKPNKILLMGSPNVGKSVFFSKLTGINVISSNFSGTTVSYTEGKLTLGEGEIKEEFTLIDVPGTYSLQATNEAEAVAVKFMQSNPLAVLCVLNATSLERGVKLALELGEYNIPIIYLLNMMDVAQRQGFVIDVEKLSEELGGVVIPTVAVKEKTLDKVKEELIKILPDKSKRHVVETQEGEAALDKLTKREQRKLIKEKKRALKIAEKSQQEASASGGCPSCAGCPSDCAAKISLAENIKFWDRATEIVNKVRKKTEGKRKFLDKLGDAAIKPWPGIPIFIVVLAISICTIVFGGKGLEAAIALLIDNAIVPFFEWLFGLFVPEGIWLNLLVGEFGVFRIAFEWIIALILPYVFLFYIVFSFLEDSGYLPRAAVLFDNIMRKLGVQGGSLISMVMGFGCAVPAIIGTRTATTKKERLIITTIICFTIPCMSQSGALIALLSKYSIWLLVLLVLLAFFMIFILSLILGKMIKGKVDPLTIELPNLLIPSPRTYFKKLWLRMKHFFVEAEGPMLIAVLLAAVLAETGILHYIAKFSKPFIVKWLGLPADDSVVAALILGIIRREMSLVPLLEVGLSNLQMFVAATVSLFYLPCLSVFGILSKEFNLRTALTISASTIVTAFLVGGLINQIGQFFIWLF